MSDGEPVFLSEVSVAIIGMGLIGGSLTMALRGRCAALYGVDSDPQTVRQAVALGLVQRASVDPAELLPLADVLVLAAPVRAILALLGRLPELHPGRAVVLDMGSTKVEILQAMQTLPERFDPIGGHIMAGKEKLSLANAEARLFEGAPLVLTPLARTTTRACQLARQIGAAIGAHTLTLDAAEHDRWTAATSHLPYLLSNALAAVTPEAAAPLAGPGYRSTARLSVTPTHMMMDILTTNRANVLEALHRLQHQLAAMETLLANEEDALLKEMLDQGAQQHQKILERGQTP